MGTDKTRRQKQEWFEFMFRGALLEDKPFLNMEQLLARFCHECNSTRQTGMEILRMFDKLGFVKIDKDELEVIKK